MGVPRTATSRLLIAGGLLAAIVFTFLPVSTATFVYEDRSAVFETAVLRAPIAWTSARALTRASYRIDAVLGQNRPLPFHLTNVGLHLINVGLLALLTWQLFRSWKGAVLAGLLF